MRYLLAIVSGAALFAAAFPVGYHSGRFDMVLFRYSLILLSSLVVVAVGRPWQATSHQGDSPFRLAVAWLLTLGCVIFVFAINYIFTFLYGCSHENCMP
jgi:hypothetical protein